MTWSGSVITGFQFELKAKRGMSTRSARRWRGGSGGVEGVLLIAGGEVDWPWRRSAPRGSGVQEGESVGAEAGADEFLAAALIDAVA